MILLKGSLVVRPNFPKDTINKSIRGVILFDPRRETHFTKKNYIENLTSSLSTLTSHSLIERKQLKHHTYLQEYHIKNLRHL